MLIPIRQTVQMIETAYSDQHINLKYLGGDEAPNQRATTVTVSLRQDTVQ